MGNSHHDRNTPRRTRPGTARAALAAERARDERRRRVRRHVTVAGSAVLVLALAAGVGVALSGSGGDSDRGATTAAAADGPLKVPAAASGTDGTVVTYGDPKAKNTLEIYEDPRCPFCAKFEQSNGDAVRDLADQGRFKVEYHFATFLDYHRVLFANHPDERTDAYASADHLLELAGEVDGLRNATFDREVRDGVYQPWVQKVTKAFESSGVTSTPTVRLNGEELDVIKNSGSAVTPAEFTAQVDKALEAK